MLNQQQAENGYSYHYETLRIDRQWFWYHATKFWAKLGKKNTDQWAEM